MKILFITNMWPYNVKKTYGIFVQKIFNQLNKRGFICSVLKLNTKSKLILPFSYCWFYLLGFIKSVWGKYDILYIHYSSHSSLGVLLAKPFIKKAIVVHVHGSDLLGKSKFKFFFNIINQKIIKKSNLLIAPSSYFKNILIKKYKCSPSKIVISPSGGVDNKIFYPIDKGSLNNPIVLGFASNLIEGKGGIVLLKAIRNLKVKGTNNFILKIVGDGPEKTKLLKFVEENDLTKYVSFYPKLDHSDLGKFFRSLDFFIFPTMLPESLGLVGLEAMACGVPVIGSAIGAIPSYLFQNKNGFLFPSGNIVKLEQSISNAIEIDYDKYLLMKKNSINEASKYESEENSTSLKNAFNKLLPC